MGCMLNFRKRNPRKQNETENFSIIRMDGGTLSEDNLVTKTGICRKL
jgi:hypothetical protein